MRNGLPCTRRGFMKSIGAGGAALALPGCAGFMSSPRARKPNIVYILADDMGYGDPTCLNAESKIPTPHINRLAAEGIRFVDAHSPSAVCTPTRYGILTGRYCWRTRMKSGVLSGTSTSLIDTNRLTVASLLKKNGYATACVGKWHLGLGSGETTDFSAPLRPGPNDLGFDYFFGIPASLDMEPYVYVENDRVTRAPSGKIAASKRPAFYRAGRIAPDFVIDDVLPVLTQKSVDFIQQHRKEKPDDPFFLYFPLTAPHTPWVPQEAFKGSSRAGTYGDFVVQVDRTVGEVLKALDRTGQAEDTLVILTSDNGSHWTRQWIEEYGHRANYHFRGQKADIWDGGHRIPFLARWPGRIRPGSVSRETICLTDLLATCAAILGDDLPDDAGEDSYNILPALRGERLEQPIREATVFHSLNGKFAIRQGPWKLITSLGSGGFSSPANRKPKPGEPEGQLYNLADDVAEENNLWLERPEVVKRLAALLERYKESGRSRPTVARPESL